MKYRPPDAIDARILLELGAIGNLNATTLLSIWDRGLTHEQAISWVSAGMPPPGPEQVADDLLASGSVMEGCRAGGVGGARIQSRREQALHQPRVVRERGPMQ